MLNTEQISKYKDDGYLVIENFLTLDECNALKDEIYRVLDSQEVIDELRRTPEKKRYTLVDSEYFLESNNKVRPFLEAGQTLSDDNELNKKRYQRVGFALHSANEVFKAVSFSDKIKQIFKSLDFKKPVIFQSQVIFKHAGVGLEIGQHQDAEYLFIDPPNQLFGVWFALEDCNLSNACLEFIPGSNKEGLHRRYIKNPDKNAAEKLIYTSETKKLDENSWVAAEVKAGSMVILDGLVWHRSGKNLSTKSRHIYTFHAFDSAFGTYSQDNWLDESEDSFLPLYE